MPGIQGFSPVRVSGHASRTQTPAPSLAVTDVRNCSERMSLCQLFDRHVAQRTPAAGAQQTPRLFNSQQFRYEQVNQALSAIVRQGIDPQSMTMLQEKLVIADDIPRQNIEQIVLGIFSEMQNAGPEAALSPAAIKDVNSLIDLVKKHPVTGRTPLGSCSKNKDAYRAFNQLREKVAARTDTSVHLRQLAEHIHDCLGSQLDGLPEARVLFTDRMANLQAQLDISQGGSADLVMDRLCLMEQTLHLLRDDLAGLREPGTDATPEPQSGPAPAPPAAPAATPGPQSPGVHIHIGNITINSGPVFTHCFNQIKTVSNHHTTTLFPQHDRAGRHDSERGITILNHFSPRSAAFAHTDNRTAPPSHTEEATATTHGRSSLAGGADSPDSVASSAVMDDVDREMIFTSRSRTERWVNAIPDNVSDGDTDTETASVSGDSTLSHQPQNTSLHDESEVDEYQWEMPFSAELNVTDDALPPPVNWQTYTIPRPVAAGQWHPTDPSGDDVVPERPPVVPAAPPQPAPLSAEARLTPSSRYIGSAGSSQALSSQPASYQRPRHFGMPQAPQPQPVTGPEASPTAAPERNHAARQDDEAVLQALHERRTARPVQPAQRWPTVTPAAGIIGGPGAFNAMPAFTGPNRNK